MALAATTIWEVETGGSDTLNGGGFDPGQTAGMLTDGAATAADTSAPVFSSASYNFVAGDVGAWLFVGAGTNWTKGWYKIASVAANEATLSAAIGAAVQSSGATTSPIIPSTVIGCATAASPTGATWSIDYSQQATAEFAYTDLASAGAGLLVASVALPFGKQQVGNSLVITGGTNFNTGRYVIASVSAGFVATVLGVGNITSAAGVAGTGGQGGALASPGIVGAYVVTSNQLFVQTGTYTVTSATPSIAGGCFNGGSTNTIEGYATVRGDLLPVGAAGTRPTLVASGISTFVLITTATASSVRNLILDGASLTSSRGCTLGNSTNIYSVAFNNFTNGGTSGNGITMRCTATGCSAVTAFANTTCINCVATANSFSPFAGTNCVRCLSYANTGATTDGFTSTAGIGIHVNCTAYGNGRDGFRNAALNASAINCVGEGNTGVAFTYTGTDPLVVNCATYNNTGGAPAITGPHAITIGLITGTASFFTNAAAGDFSMNNTAGGGAALRAAGYPGLFPLGLTTGYLDVGAAQHADPVAGGGIRLAGHGGLAA